MLSYLLLLLGGESWRPTWNWPRAFNTQNRSRLRMSLTEFRFTILRMRCIVSWVPPKYIRERSEEQHRKLREKHHILVDGEDIPPPIEHFAVSLSSLKINHSNVLTMDRI